MKYTVSYAPHNEDIALEGFFSGDKKGVYIDLIARHPFKDSFTKNLYQMGWHGVHVVQNQERADMFVFDRERDIVAIKPASLAELLAQHSITSVQVLHVGADQELLATNNWQACRPEVVCLPAGQDARILETQGYVLVRTEAAIQYFATKERANKIVQNGAAPVEPRVNWRQNVRIQLLEQEKAVLGVQLAHLEKVTNEHHEEVMAGKFKGVHYSLKLLAKGLRDAVVERATAKHVAVPQFTAAGGEPTTAQQLAHSYQAGLTYRNIGPSVVGKIFFNLVWLGMRVARKLAKLVLKRGRA